MASGIFACLRIFHHPAMPSSTCARALMMFFEGAEPGREYCGSRRRQHDTRWSPMPPLHRRSGCCRRAAAGDGLRPRQTYRRGNSPTARDVESRTRLHGLVETHMGDPIAPRRDAADSCGGHRLRRCATKSPCLRTVAVFSDSQRWSLEKSRISGFDPARCHGSPSYAALASSDWPADPPCRRGGTVRRDAGSSACSPARRSW